jgi:hypothetical protein
MDPWLLLWSAVNRRTTSGEALGPEQRLSPLQALRATTIDAAIQLGVGDDRGSLEAGKLADFIVVDRDPLAVERMREALRRAEAAGYAGASILGKPFSLRLLVARIRAILRRAEPLREGVSPAGATEPAQASLRRGRLFMDPARHHVTWDDQPVSLTVTEFLILEALAVRPGVIKSRNQLMDAAYPDDVFVDDRTVDSHIKRMRRKFRVVDDEFGAIDTLYGAGYSFTDG